jgi:hypothetical protein
VHSVRAVQETPVRKLPAGGTFCIDQLNPFQRSIREYG